MAQIIVPTLPLTELLWITMSSYIKYNTKLNKWFSNCWFVLFLLGFVLFFTLKAELSTKGYFGRESGERDEPPSLFQPSSCYCPAPSVSDGPQDISTEAGEKIFKGFSSNFPAKIKASHKENGLFSLKLSVQKNLRNLLFIHLAITDYLQSAQ